MAIPENISLISTINELHEINGMVHGSTQAKIILNLEAHAIEFINRSPFLIIATHSESGSDASPRGDKKGFVKVLDATTLLIPERPGNRLADTMSNLIDNPALGLIFMIPGMNETLRINGSGYISNEPEYLELLTHNGKPPRLAIVVDIKEVYFHCAKALIRSKLWDASLHMERKEMPSLGKILLDQIKGVGSSEDEVTAVDANLDADIKSNLYHT